MLCHNSSAEQAVVLLMHAYSSYGLEKEGLLILFGSPHHSHLWPLIPGTTYSAQKLGDFTLYTLV